MRTPLVVLVSLAAILAASCAPLGQRATPPPALTPGTTTVDQAMGILGPPTAVRVLEDGGQVLQWSRARATKGRGAGKLAILFDAGSVMVRAARYQATTRPPRAAGR